MRVLEGRVFTEEEVNKFLQSRIRTSGILRRKHHESVAVFLPVWRPFRIVEWTVLGDSDPHYSMIDERMSPIVTSHNEQLLLWRPRYAAINITSIKSLDEEHSNQSIFDSHVERVMTDLYERRKEAQNALAEFDSELREKHTDQQQAVALIIPRTPGSIRKYNELIEKVKPLQSVIRATAIVANLPYKAVIEQGKLGERVHIGTYMALFTDLESGAKRNLILETPGAKSINEALRNGRALTRLCELNEDCRNAAVKNL
ncbi:MAG: hypothetical protein ACFE7R_10725 [Candidatus Hodarchaeota archaeon]